MQCFLNTICKVFVNWGRRILPEYRTKQWEILLSYLRKHSDEPLSVRRIATARQGKTGQIPLHFPLPSSPLGKTHRRRGALRLARGGFCVCSARLRVLPAGPQERVGRGVTGQLNLKFHLRMAGAGPGGAGLRRPPGGRENPRARPRAASPREAGGGRGFNLRPACVGGARAPGHSFARRHAPGSIAVGRLGLLGIIWQTRFPAKGRP